MSDTAAAGGALAGVAGAGGSMAFAEKAIGIRSACCGCGPNDEGFDEVKGKAVAVPAPVVAVVPPSA